MSICYVCILDIVYIYLSIYVAQMQYKLSVSMFERLVKNKRLFASLSNQRRMRPEICTLIRPLYNNLVDHACTTEYPDVRGMNHNLFFLDHTVSESGSGNSSMMNGHQNKHEAKLAVGLTIHLLRNGYLPAQLVIITPYVGQVILINELARKCSGVMRDEISAVKVQTISSIPFSRLI